MPWLVGGVCFLLLVAPCVANAQATVRIWGEPGEYVTGGGSFSFASATATIGFGRNTGMIECTVTAPTPSWTMRFYGPAQHALATGLQSPSTDRPTGNEPRLEVSYGSRYCRELGDFEVRKLAYAPDGAPREIWITWAARCQAGAPRQFGDVRLNADTTLWQSHPGDVWAFEGDSMSFSIVARHAQGRPVSFVALELPAGASLEDAGNGTARFAWRAPSVSMPATYPVRVVAADDLGLRDTTVAWLHAMPALQVGYVSQPGDPAGKGTADTLRDPSAALVISETGSRSPPVSLTFSWLGRLWGFEFQAPFGRKLAAGTYENAQRVPAGTVVRSGFAARLNSAWPCQYVNGRFEVRRLRRSAAGAVTGIWAVGETRCVGSAGSLRIELLYDMDTTLYVRAPADVAVETGDSVRFVIAAIATRGGAAMLDVSGLPAGATFAWDGPASGVLRWRAPVTPIADLPIRAVGTDGSGTSDTVVTHVRVVAPARFALRGDAGHCAVPGYSFLGTGLGGEFSTFGTPGVQLNAEFLDSNDRLAVRFSNPVGLPLRAGRYSAVRPGAFEAHPLWPGLLPSGGSSFYPPSIGDFHIRKLRLGADGRATSLWATWNWGCWYEPGHPMAHGEVRINADTTLYTEAPAQWLVERGQPVHFDVRAVQAFGATAYVAAEGLPPAASFVPGPGAGGTFDWPVATPVGNVTATFFSSDASGHADTVQTLLRVLSPCRLWVDGDPSEWATQGSRFEENATTGVFLPANDSFGWISMGVRARRDDWTIRFGAPGERPLTPGIYSSPTLASIYSPNVAAEFGLVRSSRQSSTGGLGHFHVRKVALGADGRPTRLWATFDVGYEGSGVAGEVLFGDPDTTLYLAAPADLFVFPGDSVRFGVRARHATSRPVTLSAPDAPAGARFDDHGDGVASFAWAAPPVGDVELPVTVRARDDEGRVDSSVTVLHVVVPEHFTAVSPPGERVGEGANHSFDSRGAEFRPQPFGAHGVAVQVLSVLDSWTITLAAPNDGLLAPGSYPNAVGLMAWDASTPLCNVTHRTYDCSSGTLSSFVVHDVGYDDAGHVERLWASFSQQCDVLAPKLTGEIRFGAFDSPVGALANRREASGEDGTARLAWRVSGESAMLRLDRCDAGGAEWRTLAELRPDGAGDIRFTDRDVAAGASYEYRLVEAGAGGAELDRVTLTIAAAAPFGIASLGPNPAASTLVLRTRGRMGDEVDVTITDVAGRAVWRQALRAPAGAPDLVVPLPGSLPAGLYLLRARSAGRSATRRFVLVR